MTIALRLLPERILAARPVLPGTAADVFAAIRATLTKAARHGRLATPPADVFELLKLVRSQEVTEVVGGDKNFHRDPALAHFKRTDGAWFDFAITLSEATGVTNLVAYNFEIRFGSTPKFVRFDLNPPGHPNEDHGVRSHLHPSTDDFSVPSPIMSPVEILDLFIDRMQARTPGKLRR